ncbi:MAG: ASCH domain-containing protein [Phycisphaerae bacterium]|nr:ASCH domain-containing protein [Phycisphaerae bacterium]
MINHLVILKKPYLDAILDGRKQVESRFSKARRPAFGRVLVGDRLFLKVSSGPVCATATVAAVESFEDLTPRKIIELKQQYNRFILGGDEYWRSKRDSKFGFLAWIEDVRQIEPVRINKKDWRAWVVLTRENDFGLLKIKSGRKTS